MPPQRERANKKTSPAEFLVKPYTAVVAAVRGEMLGRGLGPGRLGRARAPRRGRGPGSACAGGRGAVSRLAVRYGKAVRLNPK